jgi:flagellar protein FlgJ
MNPLSSDPLLSKAAGDLAVDSRSLDALKRDAARDPRGAIKKAAQQFEALFMQMVLKSMREATPKSGMLDSSANEMYTGMLDQQIAGKIAASGTGLANMIAKQLTRHIKGAASQEPSVPVSAPATVPATVSSRATVSSARLATRDPMLATPDADQRNFVTKMWDHAVNAERASGVPAKFIVGQAALESGWGKREIRGADGQPSHNLFGIKAGANWTGRTVDVLTTEYENGVVKKVVDKFRAYNNYTEAFRDWAQLMASNPRYADVLASGRDAGDARGFAYGLQRAGYATDPAYGAKLTRIINASLALRGAA